MLSSVAERIYWAARYLERAENTARLVSVYDSLLLDLPRGIDISWYNLIELNSATEAFAERYRVRDERNVVKFLLADADHSGALVNSLRMVRENLRTTRDVFAPEVWEFVNDLFYFATDNVAQGTGRKLRHQFTSGIIRGCEQVNGQIAATTSRDAPWQFIQLGRHLERADMTTRILD
ncbi:MAG TPA: alpha-E domain-containing protein, partial [Thiobacillaceae bacterium]